MLALGQALGVIAAETAAELDLEAEEDIVMTQQEGGFIDLGQNNQGPGCHRVSAQTVYTLCTPRERKGINLRGSAPLEAIRTYAIATECEWRR